jgi:hypothetical protein
MSEQWDGRPLNPKQDGWHWLTRAEDGLTIPKRWNAEMGAWEDGIMLSPATVIEWGANYVGPCHAPAEVAAQVEAERDAERAAREHWQSQVQSTIQSLLKAEVERDRLRSGWLMSIQTENSCAVTGQPCRERCGCALEQEALAIARAALGEAGHE